MRRPSSAGSEIFQKLKHRLDMLAELLCNLIPAFDGGPYVLALFRLQRFDPVWPRRENAQLQLAPIQPAAANGNGSVHGVICARAYGVSSRRPGLACAFAILNAACYSWIQTAPRLWPTDRNVWRRRAVGSGRAQPPNPQKPSHLRSLVACRRHCAWREPVTSSPTATATPPKLIKEGSSNEPCCA